jgi:hypothetical protein
MKKVTNIQKKTQFFKSKIKPYSPHFKNATILQQNANYPILIFCYKNKLSPHIRKTQILKQFPQYKISAYKIYPISNIPLKQLEPLLAKIPHMTKNPHFHYKIS